MHVLFYIVIHAIMVLGVDDIFNLSIDISIHLRLYLTMRKRRTDYILCAN